MKTAKLLLISLLPLLVACNGNNNSSSEIDSGSSSINESSESSSSESSSAWSENEIPLTEVDKLIAKAETFNDKVNNLKYYRKDSLRYDEVEYKRYNNFYTLEGKADSYTDAWDESDVIGYYGYPSDGSIDKFYDVLKADVGTQHAKLYTIDDNATSKDTTKRTEEQANEMLNEYENDLTHFMDETYGVLRKDKFDEYKNKGSLQAERYTKNNLDTLHIVAEFDYTYVGIAFHADYDWEIVINSDGSFASAHFTLTDGNDSATSVTHNNIDMTYGDFYDVKNLGDEFNPEMYFIKKLSVNVYDLYTKDKNSVSVGADLSFIPNIVKNYMGSTYDYLPATAVDYWDIEVLSSSNEEVIGYSEEDGYYVAKKPGKATITLGNPYNPYSNTDVEITVITPVPTQILGHTPYNMTDYVGEAFTNCDVNLDVSVGPYAASQEVVVSSSDKGIATAYVNDDGEVMVHGVSEGYVTITVSAKDYPDVSKSFTFHVVGELNVDKVVGTWSDDSYYSTYSFKVQYTFNADLTGTMIFIALNYSGEETTSEVPFTYVLDAATQDVTITPIGWTVQEALLTVHYYHSDLMKTYFDYGEYRFSINMNKGALE